MFEERDVTKRQTCNTETPPVPLEALTSALRSTLIILLPNSQDSFFPATRRVAGVNQLQLGHQFFEAAMLVHARVQPT